MRPSLRGGNADAAIQPPNLLSRWIATLPMVARNDGKYIILILLIVLVSACGRTMTPEENHKVYKVGNPYKIGDRWYHPKEDPYYDEVGAASWYGPGFHGRKTANGEEFDKYDLTAAHRTLPMPSVVRVTNLENGKSVVLRVNDRGPFARGRIIDVSKKAAQVLGFQMQGTVQVRVQFLPDETAALFGGELPYNPANYSKKPRQYASLQKRERVMPAPYNNEVTEEETYAPAGNAYVQVGVFSKKENANRVLRDVSRFGVAKIEEIHQEGERFYRVRLGAFTSSVEARRVLNLVQQSGYNDAQFLSH